MIPVQARKLLFHTPSKVNRKLPTRRYYLRTIRAVNDNGAQIGESYPIDLLGWNPPEDWEQRILTESVTGGISITVNLVTDFEQPDLGIADQLSSFVERMRVDYPLRFSERIPYSALVLAAIKHESPIPSELWRKLVFGVSSSGSGH